MLAVMARKAAQALLERTRPAKDYGRRIAHIRKERGLTQVQLAKKLGITQTLLSEYERGNVRLHADLLVQVAKLLKVSADELLGLAGVPHAVDRPSLRLARRLIRIQSLPPAQQKAVLRSLDLLVSGVGHQQKRGTQAA